MTRAKLIEHKTWLGYCIRHYGIVDVDQERCDMYRGGDRELVCDIRKMYYKGKRIK